MTARSTPDLYDAFKAASYFPSLNGIRAICALMVIKIHVHWSFSGGLRYDKNDATDSSGNKVSKDSRISPRLNATYDILGNGRHRVTASYGDYVSQIVEGPGTAQSAAGSPSYIYYVYNGPAINPAGTPANQLVDTHPARQISFFGEIPDSGEYANGIGDWIESEHPHRSALRSQQTENVLDECGLAGSVCADQTVNGTPRD